jgi:acetyltransferase-like isoleucine patch superfamily enzyme
MIWHPDKSVILTEDIGEGTVIHALVWIGDTVKIGKNCKIQAFTFIPSGVTIEDNVFIGPHVCFTNDKHPKAQGEWEVIQTLVKSGASIGANSTILSGITIGENSTIGAGSVVTKDVPEYETWAGNPARPLP